MTDKIVVLTNCGSKKEAMKLAGRLVEDRLAACVNIIPAVTSVYRWKDKLETAEEWTLLVKTRRELFEQVRRAIETGHSYELPEVLAIPVVDGLASYLDWIETETAALT